MKELKLQEYGVSELNSDEMRTVEGGTILLRLLVGATGYAIGLGYKLFIALPSWFMSGLGIGAY